MLTADYHMHSVSPDARVPMEDMCQAADACYGPCSYEPSEGNGIR